MRNEMTATRRLAVVLALALLSLLALHPACPPDAAHHSPVGAASELCHHGDGHHLSPASHTQDAVQTSAGPIIDVQPAAGTVAAPAVQLCPERPGHAGSGRSLLLDLGISRT